MTGWCVDDSTTVYLRHMPVHQHCCRSSRVCCCGLLATVTAPETLLCWNVLQLCWASPPLLHTPLQCNPYASVQLAASQPQALPSQLQALVIVLGTKPLCPTTTCPAPLSLAHRFSGFRDVAQLLQAGVWHCDHAHIGLNGAKGEVGCSCLAVLNNCIEQC